MKAGIKLAKHCSNKLPVKKFRFQRRKEKCMRHDMTFDRRRGAKGVRGESSNLPATLRGLERLDRKCLSGRRATHSGNRRNQLFVTTGEF